MSGFQYRTSLQTLESVSNTLRDTEKRLAEKEKFAQDAEKSLEFAQRNVGNLTSQTEELERALKENFQSRQFLYGENTKYKRRLDVLQNNLKKLGISKTHDDKVDIVTWNVEGSMEVDMLEQAVTSRIARLKADDQSQFTLNKFETIDQGAKEDADDENFRAYCNQLEGYLAEIDTLRIAHQDHQKIIRVGRWSFEGG